MRRRRTITIIVVGIALLLGILPSAGAIDGITVRPRLRAGTSPYVGRYLSAGVVLRDPSLEETLGRTFTDATGWENLIVLRYRIPLALFWTLELGGANGDVIDDYRVDKYPEVTLRFKPELPYVPLELTSEVTMARFAVYGVASATRTEFVGQLNMARLSLSPTLDFQFETVFRYRTYSTAQAQQALGGDVRLFVNSIQGAPLTFTYHRQTAQGSSPLAFDLMGSEHLLSGRIDIRLGRDTVWSFLQQLDLTTGTLADRWYAISVRWSELYGTEIVYDEPSQKLTAYVSRAGLGSVGISYTFPSQTFGLSLGY